MKTLLASIAVSILLTGWMFAQGGGSSLNFDGQDDMVDCGTTPLNIDGELTIEAWIRAESFQPVSYGRILDKYNFFAQEGFNLVLEFPTTSGSVMLDFWGTDGSKNSAIGTTQVADARWHFVVAVFDGSTIKIFIDGRREARLDIGPKAIRASANVLGLGNNFDGATWFPFNGRIDELRLWNTALDSLSIGKWMHRRITPAHPFRGNLVGYWKFDEGSGAVANDSSGNGLHGALTNTDTLAVWETSTAPIASGITETLEDLNAVWASKDSAAASILAIHAGGITGDQSILFGHDGGALLFDAFNVPQSKGILFRLQRVWRMEVYDSLSGDVFFDVNQLGITNGNSLRLLMDADGDFSDADTARGIFTGSTLIYTLPDQELKHGYYYTLGMTEAPVAINSDNPATLPSTLRLKQNYPNPFNPRTRIAFSLDRREVISLTVYDVSGRKVAAFLSQSLPAGEYVYEWDASDFPSGVYFYRLSGPGFALTKKALLLK